MRKYQNIWKELKEKEFVHLTAPVSAHKTIIQAVRKESHKDRAFRFKCVEAGKSYRLEIIKAGDTIYFNLIWVYRIPKGFM